ncbi:MAG: tetratricopeptide repeat protein, partial [Planctomycetota bacterium]|nr:tetratricopeptide repeat protein [Planctomycetota bacterium]
MYRRCLLLLICSIFMVTALVRAQEPPPPEEPGQEPPPPEEPAGDETPPEKPPDGETPPEKPPEEAPKKEKPKSENLIPPSYISERAVKLLNEGVELMEKAKQGGSNSLDYVDQALKKFEGAVLASGKDFALAEYHRGIAFQFTQEFTEARRVLERALKVNPKFYEAMVELGDTHAWMKDYENAQKLYDRCIETKPDYALAPRNKAIIFLRTRELEKAQEFIKKAMALDPEDKLGKELEKDIDIEVKGPGFKKEYVKESAHYRIMTDIGQQFADDLAKEIELIYNVFTNVFPKIDKEKKKFPIYVFANPKDYFTWGGPPGSGGFFSDLQQKLQFFRQKSEVDTRLVLYHEGFHQFLNHYLLDCPM